MYDPLRKYYDDMLRRFGPNSAEALAWRNAESQRTRFGVLCEIAGLSGSSILDEGCGLGDLYPFLSERFQDFSYTGIDINERLIAAAQEKFPDGNFSVADFSGYEGGPFDYVLASGTLTFKVPDHGVIYAAQIKKMYDIAQKGVAFNMLDQQYFAWNDIYATYDPKNIEAFCKTFASKVVLRHDYSTEDFTLYLYK